MKVKFEVIRGVGVGFAELNSCGHLRVFAITVLMFQFLFIFGLDEVLPTAPGLVSVPAGLPISQMLGAHSSDEDTVSCSIPMLGIDYKLSLSAQTNVFERLPALVKSLAGTEKEIGTIAFGDSVISIGMKVSHVDSILESAVVADE